MILTLRKPEYHPYLQSQNPHNYILEFLLILFAIDIDLKGIQLIYCGVCILLLQKANSKIRITGDLWILYVFAMSYLFFSALDPSMSIGAITRGLAVPASFFWGINMYNKTELNWFKKLIYILTISMAAHGFLNFLYNIQLFGLENVMGLSRSYDIWSKSYSSATGQAINYTLLASILPYTIFLERNVKLRLLFSSAFALAFINNLQLGGRSFIILSLLSIIVGAVIFTLSSGRLMQGVRILMVISIFSLLLILLYQNNIGGLQETVKSSYLYHRFFSVSGQSITEDSRLDRKIQYIKLFFTYPWGGHNISIRNGVGYSHELWLDIFDTAGIIPFICIWMYTIRAWMRCFVLSRRKSVDIGYKVLFCTLYFVMSAQFLIEPIMDGSPKLLLAFCLADGMLAAYLSETDVQQHKNVSRNKYNSKYCSLPDKKLERFN